MPWRLSLAVAHPGLPVPEARLLPLYCRRRTLAPLTVMVLERGGMAQGYMDSLKTLGARRRDSTLGALWTSCALEEPVLSCPES